MKLVDTHSHPQFPQYNEDRKEIMKRASDSGIGIICVGTDLEMSKKAIELAKKYENVWASVGLHPNDNLNEEYNQSVYEILAKNKKVVAIGEAGLDYYRTTDQGLKKKQRSRFEKQIQFAVKTQLPLIIHCRDAHDDMIALLSKYGDNLSGPSARAGVIHSFTGTWADARQYLALGFYIGLNGIITFTRQYDETVINTPLEKILAETDAPYLTPEPLRGHRNEPAYVKYVARKIAELRNISFEEVSEITTANAKKLFTL